MKGQGQSVLLNPNHYLLSGDLEKNEDCLGVKIHYKIPFQPKSWLMTKLIPYHHARKAGVELPVVTQPPEKCGEG